MNILVTGGSGFIGRKLIERLSRSGHEVSALVRKSSDTRGLDVFCRLLEWNGSLRSIDAAFENSRPDIVFHLATCYVANHESDDVDRLIESNIHFGSLILEAVRKSECRRVVNTGTRWQHRDDRPYEAVNLYSATKQAFADILDYYAVSTPLTAITLELADTFGPGDTRKKIVDLLVETLISGRNLGLSPGEQRLDLLHVDDVVAAFAHCISLLGQSREGEHAKYTVSGGSGMRLREVGTLIEEETGISGHLIWGAKDYRPREAMRPYKYFPDLPGWTPSANLRERLIEYLQDAKVSPR